MTINLLIDRNVTDSNKLGEALLRLIEEHLNMKSWGFAPSFTKFSDRRSLLAIYDSEWCRVSFALSRQPLPHHDELSIEYGRLHASSEEPYMQWHGEKCHCWHNVTDSLSFLDGLSPLEAMEQVKIQKKSPAIVEEFRRSEIRQRLFNEYPPKAVLVMHATLWEYYGQRLFELFDLRRPDLWERYRIFIKEYYHLMAMKSSYGPPYENVC